MRVLLIPLWLCLVSAAVAAPMNHPHQVRVVDAKSPLPLDGKRHIFWLHVIEDLNRSPRLPPFKQMGAIIAIAVRDPSWKPVPIANANGSWLYINPAKIVFMATDPEVTRLNNGWGTGITRWLVRTRQKLPAIPASLAGSIFDYQVMLYEKDKNGTAAPSLTERLHLIVDSD